MKKVIFSLIALMTAMVMNGQVKQTYLTLNNGIQMPQFGLGVDTEDHRPHVRTLGC